MANKEHYEKLSEGFESWNDWIKEQRDGFRADFREATLYGGYYSKADLSKADFHKASLEFIDFREASLRGADLYGAKNAGNLPETGPNSIGGHQLKFRDRQKELRSVLEKANTAGCRNYRYDAWYWATRSTPSPLRN